MTAKPVPEKWTPTEKELKSLGFEHRDAWGYWDYKWGRITKDSNGFFIGAYYPNNRRVRYVQTYPKSLQELEALIRMLTP